jgi:hypothetical protein
MAVFAKDDWAIPRAEEAFLQRSAAAAIGLRRGEGSVVQRKGFQPFLGLAEALDFRIHRANDVRG